MTKGGGWGGGGGGVCVCVCVCGGGGVMGEGVMGGWGEEGAGKGRKETLYWIYFWMPNMFHSYLYTKYKLNK